MKHCWDLCSLALSMQPSDVLDSFDLAFSLNFVYSRIIGGGLIIIRILHSE